MARPTFPASDASLSPGHRLTPEQPRAYLGVTDCQLSAADQRRLGLAEPLHAGGLCALYASSPPQAPEERVSFMLTLSHALPRFAPLSQGPMLPGAMVALMLRNEAEIRLDLDQLGGLAEVVVTLSYPGARRPAMTRCAVGARLRAQAEHRRNVRRISARAFELLARLADRASLPARGQCLSPFGPTEDGRIGADLALLVEQSRLDSVHAELARNTRRLIPGGGGARCSLSGPFPPFSFTTPLTPAWTPADRQSATA